MNIIKVRIGNSVVEFQSDGYAGQVQHAHNKHIKNDVISYTNIHGGMNIVLEGYRKLEISLADLKEYKSFWMERDI